MASSDSGKVEDDVAGGDEGGRDPGGINGVCGVIVLSNVLFDTPRGFLLAAVCLGLIEF
jgi:hypothetical protein